MAAATSHGRNDDASRDPWMISQPAAVRWPQNRTQETQMTSTPDALTTAFELAREYLEGLNARPVSRAADAASMAAILDEPLPEVGCPPGEAVNEWFRRAEPGIVAGSGPRYFGFVQGGTTPAALAGDWLASAIDQNPAMWVMTPAAAQTELVVLRWLKELFGLPSEWAGAIT